MSANDDQQHKENRFTMRQETVENAAHFDRDCYVAGMWAKMQTRCSFL